MEATCPETQKDGRDGSGGGKSAASWMRSSEETLLAGSTTRNTVYKMEKHSGEEGLANRRWLSPYGNK